MKEIRESFNRVIAHLISSVMLLIFMYFVSVISQNGNITDGNNVNIFLPNIVGYIIGCIIFFTSFFVIYYFAKKKSRLLKCHLCNSFFLRESGVVFTWFIIIICLLAVFLGGDNSSIFSIYDYYRSPVPFMFFFLLYFVIYVVVIVFIKGIKKSNIVARFVFVVVCCTLDYYLLYSPNFMEDKAGGAYHLQAYASPIINVYHKVPFVGETNSIYGHYGLLLCIPVKFFCYFFNEWKAVAVTIALVGVITYIFTFLLLNKIISNDVIFYISCIAISVNSFLSSGNYFQLFPHRILFQAIVLYGCYSILHSRKKITQMLSMWFISFLSFIWNIEIGMVCTVVWMLCFLYVLVNKYRKKLCWSVVITFMIGITIFSLSYIVVGIYNIAIGGDMPNLLTYIYPIFSADYNIVGLLQKKIDTPLSDYFVAMLLFINVLAYFAIDLFKFRGKNDSVFLMLNAIMGLGVMTYYINRASRGNLHIVIFTLVILLAYYADWWTKKEDISISIIPKKYIAIFGNFALLGLIVIASTSILNLPHTIIETSRSIHNCQRIENITADMCIPEGTAFVGMYAALFGAYLNYPNPIQSCDWPDITEEKKKFVWAQLEDENIEYVFSDMDTVTELKAYYSDLELIDSWDSPVGYMQLVVLH